MVANHIVAYGGMIVRYYRHEWRLRGTEGRSPEFEVGYGPCLPLFGKHYIGPTFYISSASEGLSLHCSMQCVRSNDEMTKNRSS